MMDENTQSMKTRTTRPSFVVGFFLFLALLLAGGALGGGVYLWRLLQQSQQYLVQQQQQLSHFGQQLREADDAIDRQQDKILEQQQVLDRLSALTNQRDKTVLLAEVEYLTRLANFSLHFEQNIPQAILLLQIANQRLQSNNDTSFMKLRLTLTQQITQLQAIATPDMVGLLLKLTALSGEIDKLPLLLPKPTPSEEMNRHTPVSVEPEPSSLWRRSWDKTWGALKNIVVIKHEEAPVVEPPTPVIDRTYVDRQLQLLLAQAQWGLIHQQQTVYAMSLTQAINWVTQHYDSNQQPTKAMLDALGSMSKVNIEPGTPDLSVSLELIKQLLTQPVAGANEAGTVS